MNKDNKLGMGLGALLSTNTNNGSQGVKKINISQITPNPSQPRKNFIEKSDLVVVEGRDIGTKIMVKNADLKLFFTCSIKEKAKRRLKEFKNKNKKISFIQVKKALIQRDKQDTKRKISPLIMTKNAVLVDTTKLTIKQMEAKLANLVKISIKKKYGNL